MRRTSMHERLGTSSKAFHALVLIGCVQPMHIIYDLQTGETSVEHNSTSCYFTTDLLPISLGIAYHLIESLFPVEGLQQTSPPLTIPNHNSFNRKDPLSF